MTSTTIKVESSVRDRLREVAQRHGRTLGQQLAAMLDDQDRVDRFARLTEQMAANPPDDDYRREATEWQSDAWS